MKFGVAIGHESGLHIQLDPDQVTIAMKNKSDYPGTVQQQSHLNAHSSKMHQRTQ